MILRRLVVNRRIAVAVALIVGSGASSCAQETPDAAAQLQETAATLLGVDADQLTRDPHPVIRERWNGRDTAELVTFRSADAPDTLNPQRGGAWATLVADPVAIKTAGWDQHAPPTDDVGYLDDRQLERVALDFLRTRFVHFSERSVLTRSGDTADYAHFDCRGPGPEGLTHTIRIVLSRRDGTPRSLMVRYQLPSPPPAMPVRVSPDEAKSLARAFVQQRCDGASFVVGEMTTSSRLAEWGVPVYPVGISIRPLEVWFAGIHATTGEILDDMLPQEMRGGTGGDETDR